MVPPEGGRVVDGVPSESRELASQMLGQVGADSFPSVRLDDATIESMFCNDMTTEQTRFVLDHTGLEVGAVFGERVSRRGIPAALPKTYVRLTRDQALSPADQDEAIERLRACPGGDVDVVELDTGHNVMISAPERLVRVIETVVSGVS